MATTKPDLTRIWASGADPSDIIDPDTGEPGKFAEGWEAELPPYEYFNFLQKLFTQGLAHINEQGIAVWDATTTYPVDALVKGSNGRLYLALVEQAGNDPTGDAVNWKPFQDWVSTYNTIADIVADTGLAVGMKVSAWDYATGNNAGVIFGEIVAGGTGTDDGGSFIDLDNGLQFKQNFNLAKITVKQFGAVGDGVADDTVPIQNANDYLTSGGDLFFPRGPYKTTDTLFLNRSFMTWSGEGHYASRIMFVNASGGTAVSGDSDKELSMNTYSYCKIESMGFFSTSASTDPDVTIDYTSFSYGRFDVAITNRRTNAKLFDAQGNNGSSPYYNRLLGYLFGGDGAGGTNYTQTGVSSRQGLLGDAATGSNGANANHVGPFVRCAALDTIIDFKAGNGNIFDGVSGESITGQYYKFNDNPPIDSGTATSATQITLVDSGAGWTAGRYNNAGVVITGGTGSGQIRTVSSNTSTTLTLNDAWGVQPDATSTYEIYAAKADGNIITNIRTEGLATAAPDFLVAKPGTKLCSFGDTYIGSLGAGLIIRDESGSTSNKWFSGTKVIFTENVQNPGASANINFYVKNSVFGGVMLSSNYVIDWVSVASSTSSLSDTATVTLDVGGASVGAGSPSIQAVLPTGSTLATALPASTEKVPKSPVSSRVFLNLQTGASFSASADLQITWCATIT